MADSKNNIPRKCRDCGVVEPNASFTKGRICNPCRHARQRFLEANPDAPRRPKREDGDIWARLIAKRHIDDIRGCWTWTGTKDSGGYGRISVRIAGRIRSVAAHRIVAHLKHGLNLSIRNEYACHRCDNPICFNPDHIFVGTPLDNARDCIAKGRDRHQNGEQNGGGKKLKSADIRIIRERRHNGESQPSIARDFGIDASMVSRIILGKAWSHVA